MCFNYNILFSKAQNLVISELTYTLNKKPQRASEVSYPENYLNGRLLKIFERNMHHTFQPLTFTERHKLHILKYVTCHQHRQLVALKYV